MMNELYRPTKRLRLSDDEESSSDMERKDAKPSETRSHDPTSISISTSTASATQTVAPFLAKHIPEQHAPRAQTDAGSSDSSPIKYCYRHDPDLKCRRHVDEPAMDMLQRQLEKLPKNDQLGLTYVWALFSASPAMQRQLMLQGILAQCCFPQLSFLANSVRELIRIDFISALPTELGEKILCHLDTVSLCKAAQVSRRWRAMADSDPVWRTMCVQHIGQKCTKCGWGLPTMDRERIRIEERQHQLQKASRKRQLENQNGSSSQDTPAQASFSQPVKAKFPTPSPISSPAPSVARKCRPWKDVYRDRFKIGSNWRHGRHSTKVFRGHTNGVMCLQLLDKHLATGSYDSTVKIWDIQTGTEIQNLAGHTSGIRCLQFDDSKLLSGSLDNTIKIWNWRTGKCLRTLSGHAAGVISLHLADNILVSGSADNTIRIWNFEEKTNYALRGHTDWVNHVKIDPVSRTVLSASDDLTIRLWDLDTRACLQVFKGHVGQVQQVIPLPREFDLDKASIYDDSDSGEDEDENDASISLIGNSAFDQLGDGNLTPPGSPKRPLPPRYMVSSGLDGMIKLWDVYTGKCLRSFFGHVEGVWALAADSLRIVSGAEDRMVKVWDARTGRCEKTFTGHAGPVTCIGLSDSSICTGSEDHEVRLLSFGDGERSG